MLKRKIGLFLLFVSFCSVTMVKAGTSEEYALKVSMIRLFPMHIDWPENSDLHNEQNPFVFAVIGNNPFGSTLEKIQKESTIKNKKVKILYISKVEEIAESGCHLLFIPKTSKKKLSEIIAVTGDKPILTIADSKGYADMGVHINIRVRGSKLRFEINQKTIRQSGFVPNYHFLKLAERIIK
ncbi:YfiR family protein [Acidobacteriota bacterium]